MDFVLQDSRGFVGPNMQFWEDPDGYTTNLEKSERYSWEAALRQHSCRSTDIPWPLDYLRALAIPVVDMQYVKPCQSLFDLEPAERFLRWTGAWQGNDLVWHSAGGGVSQHYDRACRYSAEGVLMVLQQGGVGLHEFYRETELQSNVRHVVLARDANHAQALAQAQVSMPPRQKAVKKTHAVINCEGCGRFLSIEQRYTGCPYCGTAH